ncbi:hypothetical protein ACLK19_20725 [Escherichia coli]
MYEPAERTQNSNNIAVVHLLKPAWR